MRVHGMHTLVLGLLVPLLAAGCKKAPDKPVEPAPVQVVKAFHREAEAEDWDKALARVNLHAKCVEMLGDLYLKGSESEQQAMQAIWGRRLKEVTASYFEKHFGDSMGKVVQTAATDKTAEVTQTKGRFALVYFLEKRGDDWVIVDRTHELNGLRPDARRGISVILNRIEGELGRKPTLAEVNARLEEYMHRMRIRRIPVGNLGGKSDESK